MTVQLVGDCADENVDQLKRSAVFRISEMAPPKRPIAFVVFPSCSAIEDKPEILWLLIGVPIVEIEVKKVRILTAEFHCELINLFVEPDFRTSLVEFLMV